MALQDQRFSGGCRSVISADDGSRLGEIVLDRAIAAQVLQIVEIDMPVVDLIAPFAQEISDHVLAWAFRATGRGNCDKIAGGRKLRVETGIDGIEDSFRDIAVHLHPWFLLAPYLRRSAVLESAVPPVSY
jgi:hypothetical protein